MFLVHPSEAVHCLYASSYSTMCVQVSDPQIYVCTICFTFQSLISGQDRRPEGATRKFRVAHVCLRSLWKSDPRELADFHFEQRFSAYVGTKYKEERRKKNPRKEKERRKSFVRPLLLKSAKFQLWFRGCESTKYQNLACGRGASKEYVARNYTKTEVWKSESRISLPCLWTLPQRIC